MTPLRYLDLIVDDDSREIFEKPVMRPAESFKGEIDTEMSITRPSLRTRCVS